MPIPFLACMAMTAHFYHLPPRVLPAIHAVEGGKVGSIHGNTDGTQDYGVMQINTRWLGPIARVTGMTPVATRVRLVIDPCFNIAAAGAILRTYLNETHGNLMLAIGDYHSHTPLLNQTYQALVVQQAMAIWGGGRN